MSNYEFNLSGGDIHLNDLTILQEYRSGMREVPSQYADMTSLLLRFSAEEPRARHVFEMGNLQNIKRFVCLHRYEPAWMQPLTGTRASQIPPETQFLLAETTQGDYIIIVPILDGKFRASIESTMDGLLKVVCESGDPAVVASEMNAVYIAAGQNPYHLCEQGARNIAAITGSCRVRVDKDIPPFIDLFGWCTWNAFYGEVSPANIRDALKSFDNAGVPPRFMILDDGWMSERRMQTGEHRLVCFEANSKFPNDLKPLIKEVKDIYGIEQFLVWHAFMGYWGGIYNETLPGYNVLSVEREFSPGILHHSPHYNEAWGAIIGVIPPDSVYRFYHDFYRHLRKQGVDGVKVDNQSSIEAVARGFGGRVEMNRRYHEALEGAVHVHFNANLINCMSCGNDIIYQSLNSNLTRTSIDFSPNAPESHGLHLFTNAQVGLWFGEFTYSDWDMFESAHAMGEYHAAARAVSGGPVYVSDKPGAHDIDLLKRLVLPNGHVLRAQAPGRPTRDCLFGDPTREDVLLKVFNTNLDAGVIGVFNAHHEPNEVGMRRITGKVSPKDVEGIEGELFAVYAYIPSELQIMDRNEQWELSLASGSFEVFTIVPVDKCIAPIGLADYYNSSGAIIGKGFDTGNEYIIQLSYGGRFIAWCSSEPAKVLVNDDIVDYTYDQDGGILEILIEELPNPLIRVKW